MTSPLVKLMTYGGTPINQQADRFMSHKSSKRHGRKKSDKTIKDRESLKRVCPICGKRKLGLEAHLAAKHAGVAVPQATDQFMNLVFGKDKPAPSWPMEIRKPDDTMASPEVRRAAAPPANKRPPAKLTGKKRRCPICSALFIRLPQHLTQAHGKALAECPWCYAEVVAEVGGKRKCGECRKLFTVGAKGKAVGIRAECPDCSTDFYTEKLGRLTCPRCGGQNFFNGKGETC